MTTTLRIGMLSFAHMHAFSYATNLQKLGSVEIVGIWDDNPARGRAQALHFNTHYFERAETLLDQGLEAMGLDVAPTAIARARARYPQHAERFVVGDLFATPPEWQGRFDALVEHTCLCALPPELRTAYRDAAATLIRPGGILWGVFYLDPQMDPGEEGPPFGITPAALAALFESRFEVLESYVPTSSYPGREGRECVQILRRRAT